MRQKNFIVINIVTITIVLIAGLITDKFVRSMAEGVVFLVLGIIALYICIISIEEILYDLKNKKNAFLFVAIGYIVGFLIPRLWLDKTGLHFSLDHFAFGHLTNGTLPGIFLNPFSYLYSIPAATIGLAIDGAIYLYKKHRK